MTLPATIVEAELLFSCLVLLRSVWLRSVMASDHLSKLLVLHCRQERVDEEKGYQILATMASKRRQRMDF